MQNIETNNKCRHCGRGPAIQAVNKENNLNKRLDPGYPAGRPSGMTSLFSQSAFTLIELLVVVLIIGVLTAIALPQYERAVGKARFATYRALADGLAKSATNYYLTNGTWPDKLDGFDVELPGDMKFVACSDRACAYKNDKMYCSITNPFDPGYPGSIVCGDIDSHLVYARGYANFDGTPTDFRLCYAAGRQANYRAICKAISGDNAPQSCYVPVARGGWTSGYFAYTLN